LAAVRWRGARPLVAADVPGRAVWPEDAEQETAPAAVDDFAGHADGDGLAGGFLVRGRGAGEGKSGQMTLETASEIDSSPLFRNCRDRLELPPET
jgi:hypothetical protein